MNRSFASLRSFVSKAKNIISQIPARLVSQARNIVQPLINLFSHPPPPASSQYSTPVVQSSTSQVKNKDKYKETKKYIPSKQDLEKRKQRQQLRARNKQLQKIIRTKSSTEIQKLRRKNSRKTKQRHILKKRNRVQHNQSQVIDTSYLFEQQPPNYELFYHEHNAHFGIDRAGVRFDSNESLNHMLERCGTQSVANWIRGLFGDLLDFIIQNNIIHVNRNYYFLIEIVIAGTTFVVGERHFIYNGTTHLFEGDYIQAFYNYLYHGISDANIQLSDMEFHFSFVEINRGGGGIRNKIIDPKSNHSIIQIPYYSINICMGASILVGLIKQNINVFTNRIPPSILELINHRKRIKTQINDGIITENEKDQICKGNKYKIQEILAAMLYYICNVEIKDEGNDFNDLSKFENALNKKIIVIGENKKIIYNDTKITSKFPIYLFYTTGIPIGHYDYMTLPTEEIKNANEELKEKLIYCAKCHGYNDKKHEGIKLSCIKCKREFEGKDCFNNHKKINRCTDFAFYCHKCNRTIIIEKPESKVKVQ